MLNSDFSGGEAQVAKRLRRLGFAVLQVPKGTIPTPTVALDLPLHGETNRKSVYQLFGVPFHQTNRQLIKGLSPQLPDGGYCIWITLDKSDLDANYDYEDQLETSSFVWVTQRGVKETDPDYRAVANPSTRVSLFVRRSPREEFSYLGEMRHRSHEQFIAADGRSQMRILFELAHAVPDALLAHLYSGVPTGQATPLGRTSGSVNRLGSPRTQRPRTFGEAREALAYVLGNMQRVMNPAHHNYQVRLQSFLAERGVVAEFEPDFIDVRLTVAGQRFIGEIKVTSSLTHDEAFRTALGQILFYGHVRFDSMVGLVIMLDFIPDAKPLALATKLGIAVVAESPVGVFALLNPGAAPPLIAVFPSSPAAART